jgi:SAM-dependent methyltransferase
MQYEKTSGGRKIIMSQIDWQKTTISPERNYHLISGQAIYTQRYREVLKYHAPGLAAVLDDEGAYHIDLKGNSIYQPRYIRTFGFYENLAAVQAHDGWLHIQTDGTPLYTERYAWCGNYQNGYCTVRSKNGFYFHICQKGRPLYAQRYRYVGDFRDGIAVVQRQNGKSTHINICGEFIHGVWFEDLDVYHKGFARARDHQGWTHVDLQGQPAYEKRFAAIESFYNGQARVECFDGSLEIIAEDGTAFVELRPARISHLQDLSSDLVGFWRTQTIRAAVELGIFEKLPNFLSVLAKNADCSEQSMRRILRALEELKLIFQAKNGQWVSTDKGKLLSKSSLSGMDAAAQIWGDDHYKQWLNLRQILKQPEDRCLSARESYFEKLDGEHLDIFQQMISGYARHDYWDLPFCVDWPSHNKVIDAGGGYGELLFRLLRQQIHLKGVLIELPSVASRISSPADLTERVRILGHDIFVSWNEQADAIILARVLHDWSDNDALCILQHAHNALLSGGRIYVIEMILQHCNPNGGLLDLNMMVITGGRERTLTDWDNLFVQCDLKRTGIINLPSVSSIIILEVS